MSKSLCVFFSRCLPLSCYSVLNISEKTYQHIVAYQNHNMDLKSVIKTFAEAWAAASLKMEKTSSAPPLPLSPPWDTFPKIPHTFPGLPLGSGWSTQGLPMQNLATFKSMEAEQGMEGNYANELLVKMEMEERKTGLSWKKDENMNQKVGTLFAVKKKVYLNPRVILVCKLRSIRFILIIFISCIIGEAT